MSAFPHEAPPSSDTVATIHKDLDLMERNAARNFFLMERILSYEATPDEATDWYFGLDPLDEDLDVAYLIHENSRDAEPSRRALSLKFYEVVAMEKGAAILVSDALSPPELRPGSPDWYRRQSEKIHPDEPGSDASTDEIICGALLEHDTTQFSGEQLNSLGLAAEMLIAASSSTLRKYTVTDPETGKQTALPPQGATYDRIMAHSILNRIVEQRGEHSTPEMRVATLEAAAMRLAISIPDADIFPQRKPRTQVKDDLILEYIDLLQAEFTGPNKLQDQLGKASSKGLVHELVWLLDVQMIKRMSKARFNVTPSLAFHDRPIINKPALKRAFDFKLVESDNNIAIQLKSAKNGRNTNSYHPKIVLLAEDNFQDNNERRLTAKLNTYRRLIESGDSPDERANAEKYILPTAKEAVRLFKESCLPKNRNEYLSTIATRYGLTVTRPMNREERRKAQKYQKKQRRF